MRSRMNSIVSCSEAHQWALAWLVQAEVLKQRAGKRKCTPTVVLSIVLRAASRDRLQVVPWGGGVALSRTSAPHPFDVALDLTGLDRIVDYDPEDFTVTAECGVRIETLRETLAARGQELPLEAPAPWAATLGGALAANASGPRRRHFGSPRDRVLGARFIARLPAI